MTRRPEEITTPPFQCVLIGAVVSGPLAGGNAISYTNSNGVQSGILTQDVADGATLLLYTPDDPNELIENGNSITEGAASTSAVADTEDANPPVVVFQDTTRKLFAHKVAGVFHNCMALVSLLSPGDELCYPFPDSPIRAIASIEAA